MKINDKTMSKINKIVDKIEKSNSSDDKWKPYRIYERYKDSFGKVQVITEKTQFYHLHKNGFISNALYNCLRQNGYFVVRDVLKLDFGDLMKNRGMGRQKLSELKDFFKYNSELIEIDPDEI
jgi:DNA-directed RNA polymerase alpha subunit